MAYVCTVSIVIVSRKLLYLGQCTTFSSRLIIKLDIVAQNNNHMVVDMTFFEFPIGLVWCSLLLKHSKVYGNHAILLWYLENNSLPCKENVFKVIFSILYLNNEYDIFEQANESFHQKGLLFPIKCEFDPITNHQINA